MRSVWGLGLVAALFAVSVARADAALIVALDINGNPAACATDNNSVCSYGVQIVDQDPRLGFLAYGNTPIVIGGLSITGSVQQSEFGPDFNVLNTSSAQLTNLTNQVLVATMAVSDTNFTPPVSEAFISGSSTWQRAGGSSIDMKWYNDPLNGQGAQTANDTPGILLGSFFDSITLPADATSFSLGPIAVSDPNPFSMTLWANMRLTANATVVNRGQTILKPIEAPEPVSMALFGLGIGGVAYRLRRRRQA